ncbi:hypothetical protein SAMN04490207_0229 [Pseudomonas gessardii]|uniref:Uncharacterized protein n=1 Tax=Pseudomonas gessardii TaxID=78544 RepID=A0A7Y1MWE3_9PSED|nr:hypothetical protein [Pseudomonas gessardii]MRU53590.1 hypothetical protein [Pseudomonas gessardii]NNA99565.1 hypothetical protein [Pseudomonas gessardii]SDQ37707.1 hypothetical protein SAMN04490207_0229 [Pseudomonas gessardii]
MIVKILKIFSHDDKPYVNYETSAGCGVATWIGPIPKIGEHIDVEFDLNDIFCWKNNITQSPQHEEKIEIIDSITYITAELILGNDDNYAALRIGSSIILIDLKEKPDHAPKYVNLKTTSISLYPTDV